MLERVHRIVIYGVGLMGGSVGLALKRAEFQSEIIGLGRRWSSLKNALEVGAVDSATLDYSEALKDADVLFICTPVDIIPSILQKALEHIQGGCIITDVGSTKSQVVTEVEKLIPEGIHFVGAHPMAGSHRTSVAAASASLFDNSVCIITPAESTNPEAVEVVSELWKLMGAGVEITSPEEHDLLVAAASHLPHAVACALVSVVAGVQGAERRAIDFTGTGFADTTRIAAGSPEVWKGIFLHNADMIPSMLEKIEKELAEMRELIASRDGEKLLRKLERAKQIRDSIKR